MRREWVNSLYGEMRCKLWELWVIGLLCFLLGCACVTVAFLAVH